MDFKNKWINWAIENNHKEVLGKIGSQCYHDNEWAKTLPIYEGEKTKEKIMTFLKEKSPLIYTETKRGFIVDTKITECPCPLVNEKITNNPALCECTKGFNKLMHEKILGIPVEVEIVGTLLRGNKSCIFEIILKEAL